MIQCKMNIDQINQKELEVYKEFYESISRANLETKTEKDFRRATYSALDKASLKLDAVKRLKELKNSNPNLM